MSLPGQLDLFNLPPVEEKPSATVVKFPKERKPKANASTGDNPPNPSPEAMPEVVEIARPPEFTDEALALRFAERHAGDLRYVAAWGRWLHWTGRRWEFDDTLKAFDLARRICREAATTAKESRVASSLASASTVAAVERLARADRRLAATTDQWDADIWLLNTPSGVVDLQTGEVRPHSPSDHMTKITAVAPGGQCLKWQAFLHTITAGDMALEGYLARLAGYAMTGATREQILAFLHGTGANGKSVFINTLSDILGDYHRTAAIETFTASSSDRHPTELAGLRGARLVTAIETEEGRRWAESRIKSLTGGDKIAARFMRQDFFEFTPQFTLVVAGNHKPALRAVDEAIRRRFHLVPFAVTIPPEERDHTLTDQLREEAPGILAWMIRGCLEWQEIGLRPPETIIKATADYLSSEDAIAAWLDDACTLDRAAWTQSSVLYSSWKAWAEKSGEFVGTMKRLVGLLEARGFEPMRTKGGRGFTGLKPHRSMGDRTDG